jgi:hypothetical protein
MRAQLESADCNVTKKAIAGRTHATDANDVGNQFQQLILLK